MPQPCPWVTVVTCSCALNGQPGASSSFGDLDKVVLQVFAGVPHRQNGWDGKGDLDLLYGPHILLGPIGWRRPPVSLMMEESRDAREPGQASHCPGSELMYGSPCTPLTTTESVNSFPPTVERERLFVVRGPATDTRTSTMDTRRGAHIRTINVPIHPSKDTPWRREGP